jgi:hypothetical protein
MAVSRRVARRFLRKAKSFAALLFHGRMGVSTDLFGVCRGRGRTVAVDVTPQEFLERPPRLEAMKRAVIVRPELVALGKDHFRQKRSTLRKSDTCVAFNPSAAAGLCVQVSCAAGRGGLRQTTTEVFPNGGPSVMGQLVLAGFIVSSNTAKKNEADQSQPEMSTGTSNSKTRTNLKVSWGRSERQWCWAPRIASRRSAARRAKPVATDAFLRGLT